MKWNATTLKIIAVVLMFLDHIHQMWAHSGAPLWLTMLGRPVFPIFLFIMSESFHYTRSRKKMLIRLLLISWLMIILNRLLNVVILPNENIVLINSAFGTFFIAALYMLFWDMLIKGIKEKKIQKIIAAALLCLVPILTAFPILYLASMESPPLWLLNIFFFIPNVVVVEGGPVIVALGLLFYIFRKWRWVQCLVLIVLSALQFFLFKESIQWMMVFAVIPMLLYNGEKGRGMKNFFYIFYPAHIYLLYVIATLF